MLKINEVQSYIKTINEKSLGACFRLRESPPAVPDKIRGLLKRVELINQTLRDSLGGESGYWVEVIPVVNNNVVEDVSILTMHKDTVLLNHLSADSPFLLFNEFDFYEPENSPLKGDPDFTIKKCITLGESPDLYMDIVEDKIVNAIFSNERRLKVIQYQEEVKRLFNQPSVPAESLGIGASVDWSKRKGVDIKRLGM